MITSWPELPLSAECTALNAEGREDEACLLAQEALREVLRTRGAQLFEQIFRDLTNEGLSRISEGERVEFWAGQIQAVETIRQKLREIDSFELTERTDSDGG